MAIFIAVAKVIFFFIASVLLSLRGEAQVIYWSASRPLTQEDFNGQKPARMGRMDAACHSRIYYKTVYSTLDSVAVKVYCTFDQSRSWRRNPILHADLLKHEQTHFDIAELYTRRIRKELYEYREKHGHAIKSERVIRDITGYNYKRYHRCQRRYDRQTRHSRNYVQQEAWEQDVARQLAELAPYEDVQMPAVN